MAGGFGTALATSCLGAATAISLNAQLHTGDPGTAGTANVSSVTTRPSVTWNAPVAAAGTVSASNQPAWTNWAGTSPETETYVTFWNASSAGTFATSMQLSSSVTMNTGDSLTLTSISIQIPLAS
jgi:hypothetical protein